MLTNEEKKALSNVGTVCIIGFTGWDVNYGPMDTSTKCVIKRYTKKCIVIGNLFVDFWFRKSDLSFSHSTIKVGLKNTKPYIYRVRYNEVTK